MRMERMDWSGDAMTLVAQEASALVDLLCDQDSSVLDLIFDLVESNTQDKIRSLVNNRDGVSAIVDYFKTSDDITCRRFFSTLYQYCNNIPFYLETALVSIAGDPIGKSCSAIIIFYVYNKLNKICIFFSYTAAFLLFYHIKCLIFNIKA